MGLEEPLGEKQLCPEGFFRARCQRVMKRDGVLAVRVFVGLQCSVPVCALRKLSS